MPTRKPAYVTYAIIAANVAVFIFFQKALFGPHGGFSIAGGIAGDGPAASFSLGGSSTNGGTLRPDIRARNANVIAPHIEGEPPTIVARGMR